MKKILIVGLLIMLSLGLVGCSDDNDINKSGLYEIETEIIEGEGKIELNPYWRRYEDGDEVEVKAVVDDGWSFKKWTGNLSGSEDLQTITVTDDMSIGAKFELGEEYSNDYFNIRYLSQWEYEEDDRSEQDGRMQMIVDFFDEKEEKMFWIEVEKLEEGITEEEFMNEIKEKFEEELEKEDNQDYNNELSEIIIDGQNALQTIGEGDYSPYILNMIYFDLSFHFYEEELSEINNHMENYNDSDEFINEITLEKLNDIQEILLNVDDKIIEDNSLEETIERIDKFLDAGSLEIIKKGKSIITTHNNNEIYMGYMNLKENYDDKIDIINKMIDSIEFKN